MALAECLAVMKSLIFFTQSEERMSVEEDAIYVYGIHHFKDYVINPFT